MAPYRPLDSNGGLKSISNVGDMLILSWNIAGFRSKTLDPGWQKCIQSFGILCFQETWDAIGDINLEGFIHFSKLASKGSMGRAKGGLCTLVSTTIPCSLSEREVDCQNCLIIELSFPNSNTLMVINIYNPGPTDQGITLMKTLKYILGEIQNRQNILSLNMGIVVLGDFNIHLCKSYCSQRSSLIQLGIEDWMHFEHTPYGNSFNDLLSDSGLCIV